MLQAERIKEIWCRQFRLADCRRVVPRRALLLGEVLLHPGSAELLSHLFLVHMSLCNCQAVALMKFTRSAFLGTERHISRFNRFHRTLLQLRSRQLLQHLPLNIPLLCLHLYPLSQPVVYPGEVVRILSSLRRQPRIQLQHIDFIRVEFEALDAPSAGVRPNRFLALLPPVELGLASDARGRPALQQVLVALLEPWEVLVGLYLEGGHASLARCIYHG